ncbi:SH3 and cysteine-rich domain-containing protein 2 [Liparis tanakae]|uniref:SH3 and cysteine-rich domain-containing protein 2 n=1 Tax=Liparis tanakae TaxID=230148 RepID=A0A4Z2J7P2_9TELE|nr:SH3 and cysteine-rich domain-containing protein 2 [Liparis tanakae]
MVMVKAEDVVNVWPMALTRYTIPVGSVDTDEEGSVFKSGAFKRNFSSPMLVNDQLSVVKEVQPSQEAVRLRVDPVYAALRFGTSLAQMSRSSFGSLSESPTRSLVPKRIDVHSIHTYVALYKFLPQEQNDLELQASSRAVFPAGERIKAASSREMKGRAHTQRDICVGKQDDGEVFLKLSSGKKRGLVPADSIEEI